MDEKQFEGHDQRRDGSDGTTRSRQIHNHSDAAWVGFSKITSRISFVVGTLTAIILGYNAIISKVQEIVSTETKLTIYRIEQLENGQRTQDTKIEECLGYINAKGRK